jgi:hypothetical protein
MKDKFIDKANKRFNNKFDYSKVDYINAKTKVEIGCPDHGYFYQTPDKHLQSKYPCPLCNESSRPVRHVKSSYIKPCISKEEFENMFYKLHNKTYYELDLSGFQGLTKGIISVKCKLHNTTKVYDFPKNTLIAKYPCSNCSDESRASSKTKSYDDTIKECLTVHRGEYSYPEENKQHYNNRESIIKIICSKHGEFEKKTQKHLSGQGCFRCKVDKLIAAGVLLGGYSDEYFNNNPEKKNENAEIYYMKVGDYYKVGITTNLVHREKAIRSKSKLPVEVIWKDNTNLFDAYKKEQEILERYKEYRVYLDWSTEVFSKNILEDTLPV